jgi:DNA-binding protein H-NS
MKNFDFKSISADELWALHEKIASILFAKMDAEKLKLENRLEQIIKGKTSGEATGRRPYPKVYPRFQNLDPPHQTWSGRGLQPRWIREMLSGGKALQDLRIRDGALPFASAQPDDAADRVRGDRCNGLSP